ncbi:MAG: hypothetical protein HOW73_42690 [Polyangiaceae bacterium]|nr:hypothetical protein [Polyangiaceae bacterium]
MMRWGGTVALCLLLSAGCEPPKVVRSAGGRVYVGRFIQARAYEAYGRGALAEAEGRLEDAEQAYRTATELDADGPEPWTRLGAVLCRRGNRDEAEDAFSNAIDADATFSVAYRERARCALAAGDAAAALESSELATILDPDDVEAALVHVDALEKAQKHAMAAHLLVARLLEGKPSARVADRLAALAQKLDDRGLARFAADARERANAETTKFTPPRPVDRTAVDAALAHGDLPLARSLATRAKASQGEIALRAAALGKLDLAREQAKLVLDADPSDGSAAIALVLASDRAGIGDAVDRARHARFDRSVPLARLLFAEALVRETSVADARSLVDEAELRTERKDALEEASRQRLRHALASSSK